MNLVRRLKSILTIGVGWAVLWAIGGGILTALIGIAFPEVGVTALARAAVDGASLFGFWGFFSGLVFATTLAVAERGRTISTLSGKRVTLWGSLGATYLPLLILLGTKVGGGLVGIKGRPIIITLLVALVLGALSAALTLAVARRGSDVEGPASAAPAP